MPTEITAIVPEDAQETLQSVTGLLNDLNLRKIVTIVVLLAACIVAGKVISYYWTGHSGGWRLKKDCVRFSMLPCE